MNPSRSRVRADALLLARGLAASRAQAQALIMAGEVSSGDHRVDKPGALLAPDAPLAVAARPRFVSRGGDKLDHALDAFTALGLTIEGRVCLDVGASTGGFTDCLLQRGAARVIAVDVGYGQLAEKLRKDPRVASMERVNARDLKVEVRSTSAPRSSSSTPPSSASASSSAPSPASSPKAARWSRW